MILFIKIKRFIEKVRISFSYAKQGWSNFDWDYAFFVSDMIFKLKRMKEYNEKLIKRGEGYTGIEYYVERMGLIITLLERYDSEYYSTQYYNSLPDNYAYKRGLTNSKEGYLITEYKSEKEEKLAKQQSEQYKLETLKDRKCLDLALKLLNHRLEFFWH